eukprot:8310050-Pyramimonas_sp.AAC.1
MCTSALRVAIMSGLPACVMGAGVSAMKFINALSEVAEAGNHHPDFHLTGYRRTLICVLSIRGVCVSERRNVEVNLTTHAVGGVTELDLEMASKLDAIEVDYSPKWLREHEARTSRGTH